MKENKRLQLADKSRTNSKMNEEFAVCIKALKKILQAFRPEGDVQFAE